MSARVCKRDGCDTIFDPGTTHRIFCATACKDAHHNADARARMDATDGLRLYTTQNDVALEYDDSQQVRADIRAVLNNPGCWLSEAFDCALHAERLLDEVLELRARVAKFERAAA